MSGKRRTERTTTKSIPEMLVHLIVRIRRTSKISSSTIALATATAAAATATTSTTIMCWWFLVALVAAVSRVEALVALVGAGRIGGAVHALGIMSTALPKLPSTAQLPVLTVMREAAFIV